MTCTLCDGSGLVIVNTRTGTVEAADPDDLDGDEMECPDCEGKGTLEEETKP